MLLVAIIPLLQNSKDLTFSGRGKLRMYLKRVLITHRPLITHLSISVSGNNSWKPKAVCLIVFVGRFFVISLFFLIFFFHHYCSTRARCSFIGKGDVTVLTTSSHDSNVILTFAEIIRGPVSPSPEETGRREMPK